MSYHDDVGSSSSSGNVACRRKEGKETTLDALVYCGAIREVWDRSIFGQTTDNLRGMSMRDLQHYMQNNLNKKDFVTFLALAQSSSSSSQTLHQSTDKKWRAPNEGCLKMNVDASVVAGLDKIGPGAVIRDSHGFVMGAMSKSVSGIFSPFLAECMATREGLQFAWESGLKVSSVESDAAQAVHSVNNPAVLAPIGPVIEDILALLTVAGGGSSCAISHVANGTASTLACHALTLDTKPFFFAERGARLFLS
ncbi:hypothetical protein TIFTF001_022415 [Ficus carica]|uniref:RNase H type-1 domain-containing protein n=1 Tax=Ficus carica TaxID=3494 RepID=A0AA88AZI9_FICCA|nr:hypothetical protein TIFTF001_022415 [Ficus carica]